MLSIFSVFLEFILILVVLVLEFISSCHNSFFNILIFKFHIFGSFGFNKGGLYNLHSGSQKPPSELRTLISINPLFASLLSKIVESIPSTLYSVVPDAKVSCSFYGFPFKPLKPLGGFETPAAFAVRCLYLASAVWGALGKAC